MIGLGDGARTCQSSGHWQTVDTCSAGFPAAGFSERANDSPAERDQVTRGKSESAEAGPMRQRESTMHAAVRRPHLRSEVRRRSPQERAQRSKRPERRVAVDVREDVALDFTVCDKRPRGWACEVAFAPDYTKQPNAMIAPAAAVGVIRLMVSNELARGFEHGDRYRLSFRRDRAGAQRRPASDAGCGDRRA